MWGINEDEPKGHGISMKNIVTSSKFLITTTVISLVTMGVVAVGGNSLSHSQSSIYKLSNGLGVCFQRINQSFTALMLRDLKSQYLSSDFQATTGECLGQVSSQMTTLGAQVALTNKMDNFISDNHWFNEKLDRVTQMAQAGEVDLFQSNIIRKYEKLEGLKTEIDEGIVNIASEKDSVKSIAAIALIISQLTLMLSILGLFFKRKFLSYSISEVEKLVKADSPVSENHVLAQKVVTKLFANLEMPKTKNFIGNYISTIIEENYRVREHLVRANTVGDRFEIDQDGEEINIPAIPTVHHADLNLSLTTVLERVQDRAFNHGIILDANVDSEFHVKAQAEALDQFLFYIVSYAMDCSLEHNEGRKVIIIGKPLGGIGYCKVKIAGHAFDDEEFGIINGKDPKKDTNIHLVLLKELINDSNARLAVKNRQNTQTGMTESEMELIFDRANIVEEKKPRVSVLKGSKKDIQRFFREQSISS